MKAKKVFSYVQGWTGSDYSKNIVVNEQENPYTGTQHAIEAALVANHCANATFAAGPKKSYATLAHATCLAYSTCPPEFPVVLCTSQDQSHSSQFAQSDNLAATWAFFASF